MKCRAINVPCEPRHWPCSLALTLTVQSQSSGDELLQWLRSSHRFGAVSGGGAAPSVNKVGAVTDDNPSQTGVPDRGITDQDGQETVVNYGTEEYDDLSRLPGNGGKGNIFSVFSWCDGL